MRACASCFCHHTTFPVVYSAQRQHHNEYSSHDALILTEGPPENSSRLESQPSPCHSSSSEQAPTSPLPQPEPRNNETPSKLTTFPQQPCPTHRLPARSPPVNLLFIDREHKHRLDPRTPYPLSTSPRAPIPNQIALARRYLTQPTIAPRDCKLLPLAIRTARSLRVGRRRRPEGRVRTRTRVAAGLEMHDAGVRHRAAETAR
ncbi:hypothetical protein M8818_007785 [Zalaria obscura]|uniref:Uncharacterized protein n=1 Tax=Zalaria obscura TaxID=2024903 RepID=A0ACC3S586_9PEZI